MRQKFAHLLLLALVILSFSSCIVGRPRHYHDREAYHGNHRAHWHNDGHGQREFY